MTYKDFDLLVERSDRGCRAVVLDSPAGTASVDFTLPFSDERIENCLLRLGRTRRAARRVESSEMQTAKELGAGLFDAVLGGEIGRCFKTSLQTARKEGAGLRIRLRLSADLTDLPWEFLYNKSVNRFLALSVRTPLVRYIDLAEKVQPFSVTPPLRALVMISSPADYPKLDAEAEWTKLTAALSGLRAAGLVEVDRLDDASLSILQRRLRQARYHIFHFIGHGEFDRASQEGVLVLEGENHRGDRVGSQYLGMLLHDHESLRLAILNACEGARTSRLDRFAGTAQTLVQQGIPAVIAMQFEIADDVAGTFAHEFYGAVADGYPIDAAVTEARKAIFASGRDVEWGTPVLHLRAPDGRIFDVARVPRVKPLRVPAHGEPLAQSGAATGVLNAKGRAATLVRDAGVALAHGKYADALEYLAEAGALDPQVANLRDLTDKAEQQRAVADTRAARRRDFSSHLAAARDLYARGDLAGATRRISNALEIRRTDADALAVREQIRAAEERLVAQTNAAPAPNPQHPAERPGRESIAARDGATAGEQKEPHAGRDAPLDDERDLQD